MAGQGVATEDFVAAVDKQYASMGAYQEHGCNHECALQGSTSVDILLLS